MTIDISGFGGIYFDTGSVAIASGGWVQVGVLRLGGIKRGALLNIAVGAAAITHLKLTRAALPGGVHQDWAVDAALNTPTNEILSATAALSTLAANTAGQVKLDRMEGVYELGIWAQTASATTVDVTGTAC